MIDTDIKGVYKVEKKYDLIWLKDGKTNTSQSLDYFKFEGFLHQKFTDKQIEVILDELNCMRSVILDFDNGIAKKIIDKDYDFKQVLTPLFNAKRIQQELMDPFIEEINLYDPNDTQKGGFLN